MEAFAGIDWASEENAICVVDEGGVALTGELHANDEAGIRELVGRMRPLGVVRVAIERPDGPFSETGFGLTQPGIISVPVGFAG